MLSIVRQHKKELVSAQLLAILATLATVPVPLLMPLLVDEVLLNKPGFTIHTINQFVPFHWQTPILYISVILITSLVLRTLGIIFNIIQSRQFCRISKDIIFHIRKNQINHLKHISMAEYESLGSGTVITHLVTDLDTIDTFIGSTTSKLLVACLTIIGTGVILLWMHWQLGLFILLLNPIVIFFTRSLGKKVKTLKAKENSAYGIFQQALSETLEAIQQIRVSNREKHYYKKLIDSAAEVKEHSISFAWKSDAATRFSFLIFLFGFDIFRSAAMLMVLYSNLSIGEMLAVFGYLWFMMAPVQEVLGIQYSFFGAKAALARINRLQALQQEPIYPALEDPFKNKHTVSLRIKDLHFSYADEQDEILTGINLSVKAGEKIALVGASGGGKSTLIQTLIGLYPAKKGMIYYDNVPINKIGFDRVREHVVTVLQHPILFNDTIRENLALGKLVTDIELWKALEIAQLKDTVSQLEKALDTIIGRQGMRLSGGQRQRMAIARMVIAKPSIVILDEATSALDTETERKLHLALADFLKNRTTIIIAHRLSAIKQADHVYVFEEGKICEQGSHEKLINQNGLYAKLYGEYQQ
ncbi:ABC transporter ATP-binding protein [Methyloprofundus sedimenti]|uniref:ABC transporter ATP-binding protein n=1 Tax=Methyloprofundus sedimenti TaxID=1420851 RepID=A0A1V8MAS7_9GAMM|nr:ABC transporter ATP-binding protein [Methyloprofundus sedimenti]